MHTNHRRKVGPHNPRKGQGWTNRGKANSSFADEKKQESRSRRRGEHLMVHSEKWEGLYWKVTRSIVWDYW